MEASLLKENSSLSRSTAMADYYLEMGTNSLGSLHDQGNVLKRAQRRVLDMANSLGLTGNVIHKAMNRSWWDRCMGYTGIVVISAFLFFVWYYKQRCHLCWETLSHLRVVAGLDLVHLPSLFEEVRLLVEDVDEVLEVVNRDAVLRRHLHHILASTQPTAPTRMENSALDRRSASLVSAAMNCFVCLLRLLPVLRWKST